MNEALTETEMKLLQDVAVTTIFRWKTSRLTRCWYGGKIFKLLESLLRDAKDTVFMWRVLRYFNGRRS